MLVGGVELIGVVCPDEEDPLMVVYGLRAEIVTCWDDRSDLQRVCEKERFFRVSSSESL